MRRLSGLGQCTALLLVASLLTVACGGGGSSNQTSNKIRVGVVLQNFTNPAIKDMANSMTTEQKARYPNLTLVIQDSTTLQDQVSKAETLIAQHVDALALQPWEGQAIFPTLQKAKQSNVPVFLVQDDAPGAVSQGLAVTYIAGDETQGGKLVGQWLLQHVPSGNVALVQGAAGDAPAIQRTTGFTQALNGRSLNIVAEQPANWARDQGLNVTTNILTAHPDLAAIFAENDEMAFGAIQAIKSGAKEGKITLIGYNGTCIGLQATIQGTFAAEGILALGAIGQQFVQQSVALHDGKKVQPRIVTPIVVMDTAQMKAVLNGSQSTDVVGLKDNLKKAAAGNC
jgi:ribose transport system substrate-binding protein